MQRNGDSTERHKRRGQSGDPGQILIVIYLAAVIFFVLLGSLSQAGAAETNAREDPRGGTLLLRDAAEGASRPAPLLSQRIDIAISGLLATASLKQQFRNDGEDWVEAVYVFPLPAEAAVTGMRMRIGERVIVARVRERDEARQTYLKAREEGRRTSLLAQKRPNIFTLAVANIPPGAAVEVELDYLDSVRLDDSLFSYRFPLVVGPRYIPGTLQAEGGSAVSFDAGGWGAATDQVDDAPAITPPVTEPGEAPLNPVELVVSLAPGMPITPPVSHTHGMTTEQLEDGGYRLAFDGTVYADRDFVLEYRPAGRRLTAALFSEEQESGHYGYLLVSPSVLSPEEDPAREVIFILDISGSMAGSSIRQARKALGQAVERLDGDDLFNVIVFNNQARSFHDRPVAATPANRARALARIARLEADGGTEMAQALGLALDDRGEGGRLRQLVFLTDGAVGNERALFSLIRERLGESRLFTVGIGSAPNGFFMTRAAAFGRGSSITISRVEEVEEKMAALFARLEHPVITDLSLVRQDGGELEVHPRPIADLYAGEPLTLLLRSKEPFGDLRLSGLAGGAPWGVTIDAESGAARTGIATLWARRKIRTLMDGLHSGADEAEVRSQVLEVALRHQLVSRYTSLVAVEERPTRAAGELLDRHQLKTNLPRGWQHGKVFGTVARTAGSAPLKLLGGTVLLAAALLLLAGARRPRRRVTI